MFQFGKDKKMSPQDKSEIEKTVENLVQKSRLNLIRLTKKSEDFKIMVNEVISTPQKTKFKKLTR